MELTIDKALGQSINPYKDREVQEADYLQRVTPIHQINLTMSELD